MINPDIAYLQARIGNDPTVEPRETAWLVKAIDSVHRGMVEETDPAQVDLLGSILSSLTRYQRLAFAGQRTN